MIIYYTRTYSEPIEIISAFTKEPKMVSQRSATIEIDEKQLTDTQLKQVRVAFGQGKERFDHEPTVEELLKLAEEIAQKQAQENEEREAKEKAEREAKALAKQQKLEAASRFEWNESGKAVVNLYEKLETVSGVEFDRRYTNWIKQVSAVDTAKTNGYAFEGDLITDRTIEVTNAPALYLVAGTSGSRKYATTHYRIVVMRDGKLEATDIEADNKDAGWALIIRDRVAALLKELQSIGAVDEFATLREAVKTDTATVTVDRELLAKLLALV